ncbi:hypothetical protein SBA3_2220005 [Candidatus Sulfopaludibacter sp. SbA3]|nr:hypothetical protein SBA3_2220005 [Candidatus Sulfopaludibacter sp. SbA3]
MGVPPAKLHEKPAGFSTLLGGPRAGNDGYEKWEIFEGSTGWRRGRGPGYSRRGKFEPGTKIRQKTANFEPGTDLRWTRSSGFSREF